jgi:hypothetical protein
MKACFAVICTLLLASCGMMQHDLPNSLTVHKGDVRAYYGSGGVRCRSQRRLSGEVVVLIERLAPNTLVMFKGISDGCWVEALVWVKERNGWAEWNLVPIDMPLDAQIVQEITLTGEEVYRCDGLTVLMPESDVVAFNESIWASIYGPDTDTIASAEEEIDLS